jgi:pimeloyl-ACP methyl ester carboxylesterase
LKFTLKQTLLLAVLSSLQALAQSQPVQEGFVEVPGARIHYLDSGGRGAPVIFLHANTGTADAWEKQIPAFTGAGYRFIAYDRRGWGQSTAGPTGPASTGADDLLALVDYLRIDKFHLVSTAGGGFIGVDFVLSYPQRVRSFTLNCSTSGITDPDYVAATRRMRPEVFTQLPSTFLELSPSYRFANPEGVARWSSFEEKSRPPEALRGPTQSPKNKVTLAALETIKLPTLVIAGDADLYAPPALMQRVAERIKGAQFITVPDAGHSVWWETPDVFNRTVLAFIRKH